jgi:hypothetical protein
MDFIPLEVFLATQTTWKNFFSWTFGLITILQDSNEHDNAIMFFYAFWESYESKRPWRNYILKFLMSN